MNKRRRFKAKRRRANRRGARPLMDLFRRATRLSAQLPAPTWDHKAISGQYVFTVRQRIDAASK